MTGDESTHIPHTKGPKVDSIQDYPFLTYSEFVASIEHFATKRQTATKHQCISNIEDVKVVHSWRKYLVLYKYIYKAPSNDSSAAAATDDDVADSPSDIEDHDPASTTCSTSLVSVGSVEYHVAYSDSWKVPVLYFRVQADSGEHVMDVSKVEELMGLDVHVLDAVRSVEFGGAIGIQDHPVLGEPFMYLHPCHTGTLMRTVGVDGVRCSQYVESWLSLIGSAAGLYLSVA